MKILIQWKTNWGDGGDKYYTRIVQQDNGEQFLERSVDRAGWERTPIKIERCIIGAEEYLELERAFFLTPELEKHGYMKKPGCSICKTPCYTIEAGLEEKICKTCPCVFRKPK